MCCLHQAVYIVYMWKKAWAMDMHHVYSGKLAALHQIRGGGYPWVLRQKEDLKKETFWFCQSQYMTACNFTKQCCQLWTLSGESGAVAVSSHKWIICHITLGRADVCRNLWKPLASLGNPSFPRSRLPLLHIPVLDLAACLISLFSCHPPS